MRGGQLAQIVVWEMVGNTGRRILIRRNAERLNVELVNIQTNQTWMELKGLS